MKILRIWKIASELSEAAAALILSTRPVLTGRLSFKPVHIYLVLYSFPEQRFLSAMINNL